MALLILLLLAVQDLNAKIAFGSCSIFTAAPVPSKPPSVRIPPGNGRDGPVWKDTTSRRT